MDPELDPNEVDSNTEVEGDPSLEGEGVEGDQVEGEGDESGTEEGGESVITLAGEEVAPEVEDENAAPQWVRDLRKSNREKDRALRERDAEIARLKGAPAQPQAIVVGEKPTFESCEYDPEKFEKALTSYNERKAAVDAQEKARATAQAAEQANWKNRLTAVDSATAKLGVKDNDDAVNAFESTFSLVQRGIILGGLEDPKNSAAMRYALGMNPKKAKELAAIADPIKFAIAIGKLEDKLAITPRKTAPLPESRVRGSAAISGTVDSVLARLEADATKTGDRSKVVAHIRKQQQARQAA